MGSKTLLENNERLLKVLERILNKNKQDEDGKKGGGGKFGQKGKQANSAGNKLQPNYKNPNAPKHYRKFQQSNRS